MNNINFNDGFKEYTINNDETKVIRFNPADPQIIDRILKAQKNIEAIASEMESFENTDNLEDVAEILSGFDSRIREQIDYILDNKVSDIAFGNQSCISTAGGIPLYERFLNAVIPVIEKDVKAEKTAMQNRISKYTKAVKK